MLLCLEYYRRIIIQFKLLIDNGYYNPAILF